MSHNNMTNKQSVKPKFFVATTVPMSLCFFKGQLRFLSNTFDICAISSCSEELDAFGKSEGIRTHYIPMKRSISIWNDFVSLIRFIIFFRKEKPDIVHGNTPKASLLSMFAAKLTRTPVRIYMCHGLRYQGFEGNMRKLLMVMEKLSCACATEVLCVSRGVRQTLIRDHVCKESKCKIVHNGSANGINLTSFNPEEIDCQNVKDELKLQNDEFIFTFVGRIVRDKGVNELVEAFDKLYKMHSNIVLILVGSKEDELNPISQEVQQIIEQHPKIYAVGRKNDVRPYMRIANVFVLPSYREGFGMVLMEAGALGVPCIATDINGCNEIVVDNKNGLIIPSKNCKALYDAMKYMIEHPDKTSEMGAMARLLIAEKYNQQIVWKALLEEYENLLRTYKKHSTL